MNKNKHFLPMPAFVVLLALQLSAFNTFAQGPGAGGPGGAAGANAQRRGAALPPIPLNGDTTHTLTKSFTPATAVKKAPDADGFVQRWLVLEPITKTDRTNSQLTESYLKETFASNNNFSLDYNAIPKNGSTVKIGDQELKWYALDSKSFNFNLRHFSYATNTIRRGSLFWLVTVINCTEDIKNVRLAAGPNSAGGFWVNGKEVLVVPGDKDVIADLATSLPLTLKKGKNVVRAAIMNGQGMINFCLRFLDENGAPVKNYTLSYE